MTAFPHSPRVNSDVYCESSYLVSKSFEYLPPTESYHFIHAIQILRQEQKGYLLEPTYLSLTTAAFTEVRLYHPDIFHRDHSVIESVSVKNKRKAARSLDFLATPVYQCQDSHSAVASGTTHNSSSPSAPKNSIS
jgi:hypothetical protein